MTLDNRSGYTDDGDTWDYIRWRGAIKSSIRGKRGQAFLKRLKEALEAMSERKLIEGHLQDVHGNFCALGVLAKQQGLEPLEMNTEDWENLSNVFNISEALAREVMAINDGDYWRNISPSLRWEEVHKWVCENIKESE